MHMVDKFDHAGRNVLIYLDTDSDGPDGWDTQATFEHDNRNYTFGDINETPEYRFHDFDRRWEVRGRYLSLFERAELIYVRFEEHRYDGGLFITDADNANGIMYVTGAEIDKDWAGDREAVRTYLRALAKTYDRYFRGDVYIVIIEDDEGNVLDSIGDIYGLNEAMEQGREMAYYNPAPTPAQLAKLLLGR